jgi:DNA repair photolyase
MVVRDIDVLAEASSRAPVSVTLSIPTLSERAWRTTEPGTAPPHRRLRAMERLAAAGIDVAVALAPIIPGLTDDPDSLARVARAARDHGATRAWGRLLDLRPGTREHFMDNLARDWPGLVPLLERRYLRPFASSRDKANLDRDIERIRTETGLDGRRREKEAPWYPRQMELFPLSA